MTMKHKLPDGALRRAALALLPLFAATLALASPEALVPFGQTLPQIFFESQIVGNPSPSERINVCVSLKPRDPSGLEGFARMVSDPRSPNYRHFLSPHGVGELFGADQSVVDDTVAYLKSSGLTVTLIAPNRMAVAAEGTVAQVQKAFATKLVTLRSSDAVEGGSYEYRCFTREPAVPEALAAHVIDIEGLDTSSRPKHMTTLTPSMHRVLYNLAPVYNAGYTGLGRTVGVTNWGDGYKLTNVPLFYSHFGLPTPSGGLGSNVHVVAYSGGSASHSAGGETDLDVQLELAQCPLAELYLYDDGSNGGNHVTMLAREGTDNLCDLISESWGWSGVTGGTATSLHNQYLAMSAQGITYLAASGDSGTKSSYDYPAFDPEVLVIGGTIATTNGSGARSSETGWSGSGGGYSNKSVTFNVKPSWQTGTGVLTGINFRLFPDISGHAASGGGAYQFYYNGGLAAANGTSLSSPSMAGSLASVEQRLIAGGLLPPDSNGKRRFGHMHELIYGQNGRPDVYFDVLSGNNGTLYNGSASTCHVGWDSVTGWGCFNYQGLVDSLLNQSQTVVPDAFTVNLGQVQSGDIGSLATADGDSLVVCKAFVPNVNSPFVRFVVNGSTPLSNLTAYSFGSTAKMLSAGTFEETLEAYNFASGTYDVSNAATINLSTSTLDVSAASNLSDYVFSNIVQARVSVKQTGFSSVAVPCVSFDETSWTLSGS